PFRLQAAQGFPDRVRAHVQLFGDPLEIQVLAGLKAAVDDHLAEIAVDQLGLGGIAKGPRWVEQRRDGIRVIASGVIGSEDEAPPAKDRIGSDVHGMYTDTARGRQAIGIVSIHPYWRLSTCLT